MHADLKPKDHGLDLNPALSAKISVPLSWMLLREIRGVSLVFAWFLNAICFIVRTKENKFQRLIAILFAVMAIDHSIIALSAARTAVKIDDDKIALHRT
jgi:hypothetical protein